MLINKNYVDYMATKPKKNKNTTTSVKKSMYEKREKANLI